MSIQFDRDVRLQESIRIRFDNGYIQGTGWIRGATTTPQTFIGITYIVEIEESNIDKSEYPYSCMGVFACDIMELLNIPIADMMDAQREAPVRQIQKNPSITADDETQECSTHGTDPENFKRCDRCGYLECLRCNPSGCICYAR